MPNCDKCNAEIRRLPRAPRTALQELDGFTLLGNLLYWGQRTRFECSACGNVQPARDGYAMRLLKRLLIAGAIVGSFAGIGLVLPTLTDRESLGSLGESLAKFTQGYSIVVLFVCAGAVTAILVLAVDAARSRG
ncbi:MAG: hypothetical protein KF838_10430 [Phycisphaeraceae bacterium]|nr:MAG: hypothetical protein KF838_10430 [Phycisphaeraceae bacterium]